MARTPETTNRANAEIIADPRFNIGRIEGAIKFYDDGTRTAEEVMARIGEIVREGEKYSALLKALDRVEKA